MKVNLRLEFQGNISELYDFMQEHFTDPNSLSLDIATTLEDNPYQSVQDEIIEQTLRIVADEDNPSESNIREAYLKLQEDFPKLEGHLRRREKIGAIKQYRESTCCSLKAAKNAVEQVLVPRIDDLL